MGKIEELASLYEQHISLPWQRALSGAQRVIVVVYDKEYEKLFRARKGEFMQRTVRNGYKWEEFDCTLRFAWWMAQDEYREAYFEFPEDLETKLDSEFTSQIINDVQTLLQASDDNTVVALTGVACLYGFIRISELLHSVERDIKGRLVVFFPGIKEEYNYRLLDARDGWNYLAHCITLRGGTQ